MFISKKILFYFTGILIILVFFYYLYVNDTRYYLFKEYSGRISEKTEIGEIYTFFGANKWTSISDKIPKLTEVMPEILYIGLNTYKLPETAVTSITITLEKSRRIVFQSGNIILVFKKLSSKYQGQIFLKDIDIPFEDIVVDVTIQITEHGKEKSASYKFYFKAIQKFERHIETIYNMMSV